MKTAEIFSYYQPFILQLLDGALLTLRLSFYAGILAVSIGLLAALIRLLPYRFPRFIVTSYIYLFRAVPEIVIIMALYFCGSYFLENLSISLGREDLWTLNPFESGVLALGLTFGAYAAEVWRGAFLAIPIGEIEASTAFAIPRWRFITRLVLPPMCRNALAGLMNLYIMLLKDTSLLSVISVNELMRHTKTIISFTNQPFLFYSATALLYMTMTGFFMLVLRYINRHSAYNAKQEHYLA